MLLCQGDGIFMYSMVLIIERSPESVSSFLTIENSSCWSRCCNASAVLSSERTVPSWSSSSEMASGFWPSLLSRSLGTTSSIASCQAFSLYSTKSVFIWPGDVEVLKSSIVMLSWSRSWLRRVANSSSILPSLQVLLASDILKPHFWKQWTIVSVDTSFPTAYSQWIAFAILTSCIISEAFLHSSVRDTTCFTSSFRYLHLNALIIPASSGCKRDVDTFG